ncbi:hypothetical protein RFI_35442 [Reticulomyxa filosa]|uniref:Uncharacterized protein n=1 Tax=Reticulomyxa filosa TaxID=46433 RepID=X6LMP4_RETFI|nr:hypothetical protein RFI_35442 [Reticulomyxa filosa]|eukprot:ETO01995.1 hypothetical protein RFI_35442 [Reticulomyxa filosa]
MLASLNKERLTEDVEMEQVIQKWISHGNGKATYNNSTSSFTVQDVECIDIGPTKSMEQSLLARNNTDGNTNTTASRSETNVAHVAFADDSNRHDEKTVNLNETKKCEDKYPRMSHENIQSTKPRATSDDPQTSTGRDLQFSNDNFSLLNHQGSTLNLIAGENSKARKQKQKASIKKQNDENNEQLVNQTDKIKSFVDRIQFRNAETITFDTMPSFDINTNTALPNANPTSFMPTFYCSAQCNGIFF